MTFELVVKTVTALTNNIYGFLLSNEIKGVPENLSGVESLSQLDSTINIS